jgi:hypothetical protein
MNRALSILFLLGLIVVGSSFIHEVFILDYIANYCQDWSYYLGGFVGLN